MVKRALSAVVGIVIFVALCFGGLLPFTIGATVVAGLAAWEWAWAYCRAQQADVEAGHAVALPAWQNALNLLLACAAAVTPSLVYLAYFHNRPYGMAPINAKEVLALAVPVLFFASLVTRAGQTGKVLGKVRRWHGFVAFVYIGVLMSALVGLRGLVFHYADAGPLVSFNLLNVEPFGLTEVGAWLVLFVAVCVWATDTGAYLIGKSLGKRKLAPTLSPGKTVEGSLGGLAFALIAGGLFGAWIHLPLPHALAVALIAGVMGQWGDLFESALKREVGLKDFGSLMPGHGGALDRIDSLLFVAPLAFCYLHFLAGY